MSGDQPNGDQSDQARRRRALGALEKVVIGSRGSREGRVPPRNRSQHLDPESSD